MKITLTAEGCAPLDVELEPMQCGCPAKPAAPPAPKFKKGDWFVDPDDAGWTAELTGDGVWDGIQFVYPAISHDAEGVDANVWVEACLSDPEFWLPIPPRLDNTPEGYEFTGEARVPKDGEPYVGDGNRVGVVCTRGVDDTNEYCHAWWCDESLRFFGGRRWILRRKVNPAIPDRTGEWYWQDARNPIWKVVGKPGTCPSHPDGHPLLDDTGATDSVDEAVITRWTRIPPKPTVLPPGKKLTGKVINVSTCGPDVQWVSYGLGASWHRGSNTMSGPPYGHFRWEVIDDKPAPRLGFRVWESGLADDGRVMLRLIQERPGDPLIVAAVDEKGEMLCAGRIAYFGDDGRLYICPSIADDIKIDRDKGGAIIVVPY